MKNILTVFSLLMLMALPPSASYAATATTTTEAVSDPYAPTSENITRLSYEVAKLQNSINLLSQRQRELKAEIEEVDDSSVGLPTVFFLLWMGFLLFIYVRGPSK